MTPSISLSRDLVLIGGGHTHALVLRKWAMAPLPGARVTLINPGPSAPYSGMLPGFVAGHYTRDALDIDLVKLARAAGARLICGAAEGIDLANGTIHVPGRAPIGFDLASLDIGITSDMPNLPGFSLHAVPAKPLGPFATRWDAFRNQSGPAHVAVIGAGVAGAELAMAMAHALRRTGRPAVVHLIDRSRALSVLAPRPRARVLAALSDLGVRLHEATDVVGVDETGVLLGDGRLIRAGFVTGAAGAKPYDWLATTGLALQDGFVQVDRKLRSSDPRVFAVGDCAHMTASPSPKAGVFAVRQAPVLYANLRAALAREPWKTYHPQRDYLKLISLGGQTALAEKAGVPLVGPMMWRWKDHIDQTFMQQFRTLRPMSATRPPTVRASGGDDAQMMCSGCGAKVSQPALQRALSDLPLQRNDVQPLPGDDAALLRISGAQQVFTTDHLRAVTEDPALMARIAAVHALGDIWAMGAAPQAALAQIILPRQTEPLQSRALQEIMHAASDVFSDAGADIVGGHTTMGAELTIGFAVTGLCATPPITLAGAKPGDALILTKSLGTGLILAGEMQGKADGAWVMAALEQMARPQHSAARILSGAHAMTDVTGFGLMGHLAGLCRASGVGAVVSLQSVPVLEGARRLADRGVRSSLHPANRSAAPDVSDSPETAPLFDPQTAGGLLAAVAEEQAPKLINDLKNDGYAAAIIGKIDTVRGVEVS